MMLQFRLKIESIMTAMLNIPKGFDDWWPADTLGPNLVMLEHQIDQTAAVLDDASEELFCH